MKFAVVNGERQEPKPGMIGTCPQCERSMVAKCGEVKVWHWAHQGRRLCDPWWENETAWHRAWKSEFPVSWQEFVFTAESGEKHIADVKTDRGWVVEFQHSYLKPEERRSRDKFYSKLIWVVDGTRRKKDHEQFAKALHEGRRLSEHSNVYRVLPDECALLREWSDARAPVFFDFGLGHPLCWRLNSGGSRWAYITPFGHSSLIDTLKLGASKDAEAFYKMITESEYLVSEYERNLAIQAARTAVTRFPGVYPTPRGYRRRL